MGRCPWAGRGAWQPGIGAGRLPACVMQHARGAAGPGAVITAALGRVAVAIGAGSRGAAAAAVGRPSGRQPQARAPRACCAQAPPRQEQQEQQEEAVQVGFHRRRGRGGR